MKRTRPRSDETDGLRDTMSSVNDRLADHETRLRNVELFQSRMLGALIFIAAEIPIVVTIGLAVMQHILKP